MVLDGTGSVYDDTGWYLVSISWYCLILGGTWSAKGLYACIYWKKWRFGRVLPMPDTLTHSQTTEYRATQLVSSIKHKLSHAITASALHSSHSAGSPFCTVWARYLCNMHMLGGGRLRWPLTWGGERGRGSVRITHYVSAVIGQEQKSSFQAI